MNKTLWCFRAHPDDMWWAYEDRSEAEAAQRRQRYHEGPAKVLQYVPVGDLEAANKKWQELENNYVLPTFQWAKSLNFDLQKAVMDNPGKNCSVLFFEELLRRDRALQKALGPEQAGEIAKEAERVDKLERDLKQTLETVRQLSGSHGRLQVMVDDERKRSAVLERSLVDERKQSIELARSLAEEKDRARTQVAALMDTERDRGPCAVCGKGDKHPFVDVCLSCVAHEDKRDLAARLALAEAELREEKTAAVRERAKFLKALQTGTEELLAALEERDEARIAVLQNKVLRP